MKHMSDLGLEDSGGRHKRIAVKSALIFACVGFTFTFALPTSSHSQATSISTPPGSTQSEKIDIEIPLGLPADVWESMIPKDNPMTAEKVALDEKLYFDKRLASDRTVSCATCHDPATALADNNMVGIGMP
jgi:cytochrome c peroxidase